MNALTIKNLHKTYGNHLQALKGIDLEVKSGDFFGLLGPNGAGKSTTIGIICSLVNKTKGQVKIFDADIDVNWPLAKSYLGIVPQEFNFSIFEKVENIVMNQAGYYGLNRTKARERTEICLKAVDLWEKRNVQAQRLSGGMKRRLMIARAMVHDPKILILDEPTAGVDIEIRRSMWDFLRQINAQGKTIILTTHYLEEAESLCKNIAIINQGKIVEHTSTKNLLSQLNTEYFILDLKTSLDALPDISGYEVKQLDPFTLEVGIQKNTPINQLFTQLSEKNIHVESMRNKANRLEELFLILTRNRNE